MADTVGGTAALCPPKTPKPSGRPDPDESATERHSAQYLGNARWGDATLVQDQHDQREDDVPQQRGYGDDEWAVFQHSHRGCLSPMVNDSAAPPTVVVIYSPEALRPRLAAGVPLSPLYIGRLPAEIEASAKKSGLS